MSLRLHYDQVLATLAAGGAKGLSATLAAVKTDEIGHRRSHNWALAELVADEANGELGAGPG